jgi:hypothetical protein
MKLTMVDFTNPATLKDGADGRSPDHIKTATFMWPPKARASQPGRAVNYVRSFPEKKEGDTKQESEAKPQ